MWCCERVCSHRFVTKIGLGTGWCLSSTRVCACVSAFPFLAFPLLRFLRNFCQVQCCCGERLPVDSANCPRWLCCSFSWSIGACIQRHCCTHCSCGSDMRHASGVTGSVEHCSRSLHDHAEELRQAPLSYESCLCCTVHVGSPRLCRAHLADTRRHAQQDVDDQGGNTCRRSRSFWSKRHCKGVARDLGQNHNRGARVPAPSHRHHVTSPARMHRPKRVSRHKKRGKPTCQPHPSSPGVVGQRQRCRSRRRNSHASDCSCGGRAARLR